MDPTKSLQRSAAEAEAIDGVYHGPPALSSDGRRVAVMLHPRNADDHIVVYDFERGIRAPIGGAPRPISPTPCGRTTDGT